MKCRSVGTPQQIDYTLDPLPPELIIQSLYRWVEENVLDNAIILNIATVVLRVAVIPKSVHKHLNTHLFWLYSAATRRQRITAGMHKFNCLRCISGRFSPVDAKPASCWAGPAVTTQYLHLSFGQFMRVNIKVQE